MTDYLALPADLPEPEDDGAAAHLPGVRMPAITLPSSDGARVDLAELGPGRTVVYVYPLTGRPGVELPQGWDTIPGARGCTTEACDFRDSLNPLAGAGYQVLGVSKDELPALVTFKEEEHLTFPLLSDPGLGVHKAYGVWGEKQLYGKTIVGTIRSTFVIDEEGRISLALYNVKATGHVAMLRKRIGLAA
jgi:peroxiredoxin Q/BCP